MHSSLCSHTRLLLLGVIYCLWILFMENGNKVPFWSYFTDNEEAFSNLGGDETTLDDIVIEGAGQIDDNTVSLREDEYNQLNNNNQE
jgi:hypothetical protein